MDSEAPPPEDVLVLLAHPFGDTWTTLAEWIEHGPGPRTLQRPVKARSRLTGEDLPLSVVPQRYRNDGAARLAVERGQLKDPWADRSDETERADRADRRPKRTDG